MDRFTFNDHYGFHVIVLEDVLDVGKLRFDGNLNGTSFMVYFMYGSPPRLFGFKDSDIADDVRNSLINAVQLRSMT